MIKMFASDLDGTLLNAMHEADRTIRGAIKEALAQGARVVPATGRSVLPTGENGFTGLKVDGVCANGSIVRGSYEMHQAGFQRDNLFRRIIMRGMRARGNEGGALERRA